MRFSGCSLRWLMPVPFILSAAAQVAAQKQKQTVAGDMAEHIKRAERGDAPTRVQEYRDSTCSHQ